MLIILRCRIYGSNLRLSYCTGHLFGTYSYQNKRSWNLALDDLRASMIWLKKNIELISRIILFWINNKSRLTIYLINKVERKRWYAWFKFSDNATWVISFVLSQVIQWLKNKATNLCGHFIFLCGFILD